MTHHMIDNELNLRDPSDAAETSSADETGFAWAEIREQGFFGVMFHVASIDTEDEDETYSLTVDVDSVAGFTDSPVELASLTITSAGTYTIPLSGDFVAAKDPNAAAIRVGCTLAGTSPSIKYGAWIVPAR